MDTLYFYGCSFFLSAVITAGIIPFLHRYLAKYFLDRPGGLKQHAAPIPLLGGSALFAGLVASLLFIRFTTHFPSGTLHSLRGILSGVGIIFLVGILDDIRKPAGLSILYKLLAQVAATCGLVYYGIHISLEGLPTLSYLLTFLWVIGLTNAFNLLDISDGLCVSQAWLCALGLYLISLPSEHIYVNFAACALLGACSGFWPYNHARNYKTFLGDSGSTLLGFLLSSIAMGADYSHYSQVGFLAPLFIFAIPICDTTFVSVMRLLKGKNPLKASNDHAAIRLRKQNLPPSRILLLFFMAGILCNLTAYWVTRLPELWTGILATAMGIFLLGTGVWLARLPIEK